MTIKVTGKGDGRWGRIIVAADARFPVCPSCRSALRRVTANLGSVFMTCEGKLDKERCGQHLHIVGAPEGVCFVVPLTKGEFEHLSQMEPRTARDVYLELGLLGWTTRPAEA